VGLVLVMVGMCWLGLENHFLCLLAVDKTENICLSKLLSVKLDASKLWLR
jgi:hypothetical protein